MLEHGNEQQPLDMADQRPRSNGKSQSTVAIDGNIHRVIWKDLKRERHAIAIYCIAISHRQLSWGGPMHMYMRDLIKPRSDGFWNRNVYIFRSAPKLFSVHF